jgi:uncharacterized protein (TIGR00290 family)
MPDRSDNARTPVVLAWSGGKDSALALHALQSDGRWDVVGLLTTIIEPAGVVSMHRVPLEVIRDQAAAAGLPLAVGTIPEAASNLQYEQSLRVVLRPLIESGVRTVAFGDLFLDDIRAYREGVFNQLGMECVFPIWGRDTPQLAEEFIAAGFKAWICCVDAEQLADRFCGREFEASVLSELPPGVDPCGENGEFHTVVTEGPCFTRPVRLVAGNVVQRGRFWYCEFTLCPSGAPLAIA